MYQSGYQRSLNQRRTQKKRGLMLGVIGLIIIISFLSLKFISSKEQAKLEATWQSEETGQILTFSVEGRVTFNGNLPDGIYHIIAPNKMEYTMNGQSFQMLYYIEEQRLYWGLNEETLEIYKWLGN